MKSTKPSVEQLVKAGAVLDGLGAGSDASCPVLRALAGKISEKYGCSSKVSPSTEQQNCSYSICEGA